jgi:AhpD family alkylhydroperoxidase
MLKNIAAFALLSCLAFCAEDQPPLTFAPVSLSHLEISAKARVNAAPRAELGGNKDDPNYLRALALVPHTEKPMERLFRAALFTGSLDAEQKMAMGLRIAQLLNSPYVAVHTRRLLQASNHGRELLDALSGNRLDSLPPADRLALQYAELLTGDVHGVGDSDFRRIRAYFDDGQIVELTTTVCFFNYLTRFSEALHLPVEPWAFSAATGLHSENVAPIARVTLISDVEMEAIRERQSDAASQAQSKSWGIGFANSMRAMYLTPQMAQAWFAFGRASREYESVNREMKLQISFAVSMANGCRYCTLHQVLGLRRLGVSPTKLVAMRKDDKALTPAELTAVNFARKLTGAPWTITDEDYGSLEHTFGKQGALEVVMQTCNFAYMNHFTDGLRLPSEDEAVKTYREVYGSDFVSHQKEIAARR